MQVKMLVLNVKDDALATLDNAISKVDESRSKLMRFKPFPIYYQ